MREALRQHYLQAMGIQLWESRINTLLVEVPDPVHEEAQQQEVVRDAQPDVVMPEVKPVSNRTEPDWSAFHAAVNACQQCTLHENRIFTVPGTGDHSVRLMLVGEAPGAEEDRQGEPFVGSAGHLLDEMLRAIGLQRQQVYITNLVKCRPPNNRDPEIEELLACESFLMQQIEYLQPSLIVALGRAAAQQLLKTEDSLADLRGRLHNSMAFEMPVLATYHPAYLLRKPLEKRKSWQDLQSIADYLRTDESA